MTNQNVIYISTLMGDYKTGLVFSIIEGLSAGASLKLVCDNQMPTEFEQLLQESGLKNLKWQTAESKTGDWELTLTKEQDLNSAHVGCCGMCGGHSQIAKG